jgi:uncharacterized protein (DUF488 family)
MPTFDLLTIGHSNIPADRFVDLLRGAGVNAIADVRSTPASRRFPWFSAKNLAARLQQDGMLYLPFGEALSGRPRDAGLYRDSVADYEAMAKRPEFCTGLDRLRATAAQHQVCLMCAEREPLDCHRCLLVARALAERGLAIGHILHDGTVAPHAAIEQRLLADYGENGDLFSAGHSDRLAAAYRRRARAVAYRAKAVSSGANAAAETR